MQTRDRKRTILAFAARGRSAFYHSTAADRPLELREAFRAFAEHALGAASVWLERLGGVNRDEVWSILERVPDERMSGTCKRFTLELLLANQQRLLEKE